MNDSPDIHAARALHDELVVIDLHADTPKIMHTFGYDLSIRHKPPLPGARYGGHVDLPRMREGGLGAQIFGMWTFPYPRRGCARSLHRQLDVLWSAIDKAPEQMAMSLTEDQICSAQKNGQVAVMAGIEGGQALEGDIRRVEEFARRGVRYIGLLHFSNNELGAPQKGVGKKDTQGLTAFGREVIEEMNRLGVIVDLSHINRKGFFEALDVSNATPIVSHTGVAGAYEHWRNIDDAQIRAIADRGGVVGLIFAPRFLGKNGIDAVCDHILHVIRIGGEDLPALGSDYDGLVKPPRGLEDISRLPYLTAALLKRGLSRNTVKKLLGKNALRVLGQVPPLLH